MMVTGVQAVGSKGVTAVQGAVVDTSETTRSGLDSDADSDAKRAAGGPARGGIPQPVVFPRNDIPIDHRPVGLRQKHAVTRYRADGGHHNSAA
jgi:hypothetical protein